MMLRAVLIVGLIGAAALTATAYEGEHQAEYAFATVSAMQAHVDHASADRRLAATATSLERSWARPLIWNAHANEALSAIYARRFELTGERALLDRSAAAARRTLQLSPLLLQTWVRSAQLSLLGAAATPCEAIQCLETSWEIAPISDVRTDCLRLQLAHEAHMNEQALARRIATYAQTGAARADIVRCLNFLSPEQRLSYVLRAQAQ